MNKKLNTGLFIFLATIFNIILAVILLIGVFYIAALIGKKTSTFANILLIILIPTSLFATFLIYYNFVDFLEKKFNISNYIDSSLIKKKKNK